MKKIFLTLTLVFFSLFGFSQVGINTENPQQLFHTDGKSSEQTTNPKTGIPTATQQEDDVVITKEGQVGIGTISPSEKLEVNGKAKINDLPENGKEGFVGEKTLVADKDGVVGFLNGLPPKGYDDYYLTKLEGFIPSKARTRSYTYDEIIYECDNNGSRCTPDPTLVINPSYTTSFDLKSNKTDKFIILSIDYYFTAYTIDNYIPKKSYWVRYDIEVLVNDQRAKIYSAGYDMPQGAGNTYTQNKFVMISLEGINLKPTNNTIKVKLIPTKSLMKINAGTEGGNFATGNVTLLDTGFKDVSFFLYEKE